MSICPFDQDQQRTVAAYPFGVTNSPTEGMRVFQILSMNRGSGPAVKRYDTSRPDPTLVEDVLCERFDPDKRQQVMFYGFVAFFATLELAIEAIREHEAKSDWERQHVRDCKKAVETARRNLRAAEQSQQHSVWAKFGLGKSAPRTMMLTQDA